MRYSVSLFLLCVLVLASPPSGFAGKPAPPAAEAATVQKVAEEHAGSPPTWVRVSGDWAVSDRMQAASPGQARRRAGFLVLQRTPLGWKVVGELGGTGTACAEALEYHGVPGRDISRLVPPAEAAALKPILAFAHRLLPAGYPTGHLLEGVAVSGDWALCAFRGRVSIKKPDFTGWLLMRRTDDGWHLVERSTEFPNLGQYGVPRRVERILSGEAGAS